MSCKHSLFLLFLGLVACDCAAQVSRTGPGADGGPSEQGAQCADGVDNDLDGVTDCLDSTCIGTAICGGTGLSDAMVLPGSDGSAGEGCEAINVQAMTELRPVDIIWVVDSSGSMDDEQRLIQENMNSFVSTIAMSGIDYRVVGIGGVGNVPPPLGGSDRLRLVGHNVDSEDGLIAVVQTWGSYEDFLRDNALTHIVHVTDDDSHDYGWQQFKSEMEMRLGHDFVSHAIVSPPAGSNCIRIFDEVPVAGGCMGPYGQADCNGEEYWALAADTGGQQLSICAADWSGLFGQLVASIAVPMPVPCEFAIPDPPAGMTFITNQVNVIFTPTGGAPLTVPNVGSMAMCGAGSLGWYYDSQDNPTRILLCPDTCTSASSDATARIDIALGCTTVLL